MSCLWRTHTQKRAGLSLPHMANHQPLPVPYPVHRGAGTDSNVFAVVYGDKNTSGEVKLEGRDEDFARGASGVFKVKLMPLGEVSSMRIGHDAKGTMPRWHLDRVTVKNLTLNTAPVVFPCGAEGGRGLQAFGRGGRGTREAGELMSGLSGGTAKVIKCLRPVVFFAYAAQWFATDMGDKKIVRLLRLKGAKDGEVGEPKLLRYKVVVKTSDVKGAGACRVHYGHHHSAIPAAALP